MISDDECGGSGGVTIAAALKSSDVSITGSSFDLSGSLVLGSGSIKT